MQSMRPSVIELFTSLGCNSCPPAEALLGSIANDPRVIALVYQVDYWDYLGWKNPFALPDSELVGPFDINVIGY